MKHILFFDTETTGLYNFRAPASDPSQPHIVQLAALLMDENESTVMSMNVIVRPEVKIPEEASEIHGITDDIANKFGVHPSAAISLFNSMATSADILVAHNIGFDKKIAKTSYLRTGVSTDLPEHLQHYCTMKSATKIVSLPPTPKMVAAGMAQPKSPRLEECIKHFFDEDLEGAHDAMVDVLACKRVYFKLQELANTEESQND